MSVLWFIVHNVLGTVVTLFMAVLLLGILVEWIRERPVTKCRSCGKPGPETCSDCYGEPNGKEP